MPHQQCPNLHTLTQIILISHIHNSASTDTGGGVDSCNSFFLAATCFKHHNSS